MNEASSPNGRAADCESPCELEAVRGSWHGIRVANKGPAPKAPYALIRARPAGRPYLCAVDDAPARDAACDDTGGVWRMARAGPPGCRIEAVPADEMRTPEAID